MHYYEKLTLGVWRPRTTTLDAPTPGPTIRRVKQVDGRYWHMDFKALEAIYGNAAMIVKETEEAAAKLNEVADVLAAPVIPPFQLTEAQRKVFTEPPPFTATMNELIARLGLKLDPVRPGDLIGQALVPVLINMADRIIALEQAAEQAVEITADSALPDRLRPRDAAVAARHTFDGFGWQYADAGSGSDWEMQAWAHADCELLCVAPTVDWQRVAAQLALAGSHAEDQLARFGGDGSASGLTKALADFDAAMKEEAGQ